MIFSIGCTVAAVVAIIAFSELGAPVAPPGSGGSRELTIFANEVGSGSVDGNDRPVLTDTPHVRITVTSREEFFAPPIRLPMAKLFDGTPLTAQILAGIGAGFDADWNRRGASLIGIEYQGSQLVRQIVMDQGDFDAILVGARVVIRGRVLDAAKKPAKNAKVWLGELGLDDRALEFACDKDGFFEANAPAGQGIPFVARADNCAATWRTITVESGMKPLTDFLQPSTSLKIQLAARSDELEEARAYVVPLSSVSTGLAQWPFFVQSLTDGYRLDASGATDIDGLPQYGSVGIVVRHPLAALTSPVAVRLSSDAGRVVVPVTFTPTRHAGSVVSESGEPIAFASLWHRPSSKRLAENSSQRLLPPHLDVTGACYCLARDGQFLIGLIDDKRAIFSVRADGHAGRDLSLLEVEHTPVILPTWSGGEPSLRVMPPVANSGWRVSINLGGQIEEDLAANDAFVVALPHAGRFDIEMHLEVAGQPQGDLDYSDLMVTGPVDLVTPRPN